MPRITSIYTRKISEVRLALKNMNILLVSRAFSIAIFSLVGEGGSTTPVPTQGETSTSWEQGTAATTLEISGNFKHVLRCLKYVQTGKYAGSCDHGNADHWKFDCISQNPLRSSSNSSILESPTLVCQVQQEGLREPVQELAKKVHLEHQALLQLQVSRPLRGLGAALGFARGSTKIIL